MVRKLEEKGENENDVVKRSQDENNQENKTLVRRVEKDVKVARKACKGV